MQVSLIEEHDLAFRSQKGQRGVLEALQNPEARSVENSAALEVGLAVLIRVREIFVDDPVLSEEVIPDPQTRASLQRLLHDRRRIEEPYVSELQIDASIRSIRSLLAAGSPTQAELVLCLGVLRAVAGYRPEHLKLAEFMGRNGK